MPSPPSSRRSRRAVPCPEPHHAHDHSSGEGRVYPGRFKSFPIQDDERFLTVCRYVERNVLQAGLVKRDEQWRW
jgi:putative transposase